MLVRLILGLFMWLIGFIEIMLRLGLVFMFGGRSDVLCIDIEFMFIELFFEFEVVVDEL